MTDNVPYCRLTFAIGFGDHGFDLTVKRIAADISQSISQFRRLDAVAAVTVELVKQSLVLCTTSSQCLHIAWLDPDILMITMGGLCFYR